jgi:hypothetical protein
MPLQFKRVVDEDNDGYEMSSIFKGETAKGGAGSGLVVHG